VQAFDLVRQRLHPLQVNMTPIVCQNIRADLNDNESGLTYPLFSYRIMHNRITRLRFSVFVGVADPKKVVRGKFYTLG
jgi:hypothetical protein